MTTPTRPSDHRESLADFIARTVPAIGGPCDGQRCSRFRPGYEFTGYHFGHGVEATYRMADDGESAVFVEGSERAIESTWGGDLDLLD